MDEDMTVLITGAPEFLGSAIVLRALARGYKVKGVVATQEEANAFLRQHPQKTQKLRFSIVPDLTDEAALLAATIDADYIIHTGSSAPESSKPIPDVLNNAIESTRTVLRVASQRPAIKHVVITSSEAAVTHQDAGITTGKLYTAEDRSSVTWEDALPAKDPVLVAELSRLFAERTAWDYVENQQPHFSITVFCPARILGPPMQPIASLDKLDESSAYIWNMLRSGAPEIPPTLRPLMIDVRDLAQLHVDALPNPSAKNQRYLAAGDSANGEDIVSALKEVCPEITLRPASGPYRNRSSRYTFDTSKTELDFEIEWTPLKKTIADTVKVLLEKKNQLAVKP